MTGYNVENPLGKGRKISGHYPYNGIPIIEQETFSIGIQMFLLKIGVPQICFETVLTWSSSKGQALDTKDPSKTTYRISLTISSWKNG